MIGYGTVLGDSPDHIGVVLSYCFKSSLCVKTIVNTCSIEGTTIYASYYNTHCGERCKMVSCIDNRKPTERLSLLFSPKTQAHQDRWLFKSLLNLPCLVASCGSGPARGGTRGKGILWRFKKGWASTTCPNRSTILLVRQRIFGASSLALADCCVFNSAIHLP